MNDWTETIRCPFGQPGDRLWVREKWGAADCMYSGHEIEEPGVVAYAADKSARFQNPGRYKPGPVGKLDLASWNWNAIRWRSPATMPRWASRWTLENEAVAVEWNATAERWDWIVGVKQVEP